MDRSAKSPHNVLTRYPVFAWKVQPNNSSCLKFHVEGKVLTKLKRMERTNNVPWIEASTTVHKISKNGDVSNVTSGVNTTQSTISLSSVQFMTHEQGQSFLDNTTLTLTSYEDALPCRICCVDIGSTMLCTCWCTLFREVKLTIRHLILQEHRVHTRHIYLIGQE